MVHSQPDWLDYTKQLPTSWPSLLASSRSNDDKAIPVPVFWGAHESSFGIRDFSKSSKLRLEKFLGIAAQSQVRTVIHLGFFPNPKTFPDWSREIEQKSYVPEPLWEDAFGVLRKVEVPSLLAPRLTEGFISFLNEVLGILALYRSPEGPVASIQIHTGIYDLDLSLADQSEFRKLFAQRYADVQTLNQRFQTTFKSIEDATSKNGLRTLSDKRPWLAAYDYQWCRRQVLKNFTDQVEKVFRSRGLLDLLKFSSEVSPVSSAHDFEVLFEDTLIETLGRYTVYPRSLSGIPNPMSILAFRMAEHIESACQTHCVSLSFLMSPVNQSERPRYCVIGGRYLPSQAHRRLLKLAEAGKTLFFPFGLPHFNEELEPLDWQIKEKVRVRKENSEFVVMKLEAGRLITPATEFSLTHETFDRILASMELLKTLES